MTTVSWRRATAVLAATVLGIVALVVVLRSDGLSATEAASSRAVRWVAHRPSGSVVLVDGFGGRAIYRILVGDPGDGLSVVEGRNEAFVVNESSGDVRALDTESLEMGPSLGLWSVSDGRLRGAVAPAGLVLADSRSGTVGVIGADSEDRPTFSVDVDSVSPQLAVDRDGTTWSVVDSDLVSVNAGGQESTTIGLGSDDVRLSLVGSTPLLADRNQPRVRLGPSGSWVTLERKDAAAAAASEFVVQEPGPSALCGWVAQMDHLWCVDDDEVVHSAWVRGMRVGGGDRFAVAGDIVVVVDSSSGELSRYDWVEERRITGGDQDVRADGESLELTVTADAVWIDDVSGDDVWVAHPWGVTKVDKDDASALVRDDGPLVAGEDGVPTGGGSGGSGEGSRIPNREGQNDPPVANDDRVSARAGGAINIPVLANDYDPDDEPVVIVDVGGPAQIGSATTVVFTPEPGFVGTVDFEYVISDPSDARDSATVTVEILSPDAPNQAPRGVEDQATTGPGNSVVIDVLANDVDPERDTLNIAQFTPVDPDVVGEVRLASVSGRPALQFTPAAGFEGRATFTYQPIDDLGAVGDDVRVVVEVALASLGNRPPIAEPDSLRLRANTSALLAVTSNDVDPDGDSLTVDVDQSRLPDGLEVQEEGNDLRVTVLRSDRPLIPFTYTIDDGMGHEVTGSVLVAVISDEESNRPPIANPDQATVVVGEAALIAVVANDEDPDQDSLSVIEVTQPDNEIGTAVLAGDNQVLFTPFVLPDDAQATARFTYTISDGNQHETVGTVSVTVLPEPLPDPPFARDDFATTFVDEPVTIDVLRNDLDPSGGTPQLSQGIDCQLGGTATIVSSQLVRFIPPPGEDGRFTCRYRVSNPSGGVDDATITITVEWPPPQNQAPIATADQWTVTVGQRVAIPVLQNDRDPDGDQEELSLVSTNLSPSSEVFGDFQREGNQIIFTAGSRPGLMSIVYGVADPGGRVGRGTLTVSVVEAANQAPVARPDFEEVLSTAGRHTVNVVDNDLDPDGPNAELQIVGEPQRVSGSGRVSSAGRLITVEFDDDYEGVIVVEYAIADADGATADSRLELTVRRPANSPPTAIDDRAEVVAGDTVSIPVLRNDTDPEGTPLTVRIVREPDAQLGRASVENRQIVFRAASSAAGTAEIGYEVSDGELTATATVLATVLPCTVARPEAQSPTLETPYQTGLRVRLADYARNGTVVDVSGPPGFDTERGLYTPPAGFSSNAVISYSVVNACGQRANGTITIDVNQAPESTQDVVVLPVTRARTNEFPIGSYVIDDEPLRIQSVNGAPAWVSVTWPTLTASPPEGTAARQYSFSALVADPGGLSVEQRFVIDVRNAAPTADDDGPVDVSAGPQLFTPLNGDIDPDGPETDLRVVALEGTVGFSNGVNGTVELLEDGKTVRISPNGGRGTGTFTYRAQDPDGGRSAPATVTVKGRDPNRAPVVSDQEVNVTIREGTKVALDFFDPDGDPLTVEVVRDDEQIVKGTPTDIMTVRPRRPGTFRVVYRVFDGTVRSEAATLTVIASAPVSTTTIPTTDPPPTDPPPTDPPPTDPSGDGDEPEQPAADTDATSGGGATIGGGNGGDGSG